MSKLLWGIDLGGTKIEGVVLDPFNDNQVLVRKRIPTEAQQGYDHVLGQIKTLIDMMNEEVNAIPQVVGIGTPGTLDPYTQLLKNSNSTVLNTRPFKRDLEKKLGIRIRMANDANCFALAEARMGAVPEIMPKATLVYGVIMGTGVGGGIVINGRVWPGIQGIGGEWGHNFLDASGGKCYCGKEGCVETIISGPALERYYTSLSGEKRSLKEITTLAENSNKMALLTLDRLVHFFGKGIAQVINILDPEVIVLGGGVGNIDILYTKGVLEAARHVFNNRFDTHIIRPRLGDSAGVFGAAFLTEV